MKKIILAVIVLLAVAVQAGATVPALAVPAVAVPAVAVPAVWTPKTANVDFTSHKSYYSCDYVQGITEAALLKLGARKIQASCTGGYPYSPFVNVTAHFLAASPAASGNVEPAAFQATEFIGSNDSCDVNEQMLRQITQAFVVQNFSDDSTCRDSQGRLNVTAEVLR